MLRNTVYDRSANVQMLVIFYTVMKLIRTLILPFIFLILKSSSQSADIATRGFITT